MERFYRVFVCHRNDVLGFNAEKTLTQKLIFSVIPAPLVICKGNDTSESQGTRKAIVGFVLSAFGNSTGN
jgi:hypothetical protein